MRSLQALDVVGDRLIVPLQDSFDEDDYGEMQSLFGIPDKLPDGRDLRTAGTGYAFEERVPSHYLTIGDDGQWDQICMSLSEEKYGHVFVWQPGEPWEPDGKNVQTEEYLRPVADSFADFWNLLQTEDEYWKDKE